MNAAVSILSELPGLCRGQAGHLRRWLVDRVGWRTAGCVLAIVLGCGAYGYTLGFWRSPAMGLFVAAKLPLIVLLTVLVNGLLNGLLAVLLGSGLGFRQTMLAVLMSFATFALVAGSLSPVTLFLAMNLPGPDSPDAAKTHSLLILVHTVVIALAGIVANARLYPLLRSLTSPDVARRVFLAWLAGNLLVGAQLSWNLRPFFGTPSTAVEFVRKDWNRSSFYENILHHVRGLLHD